MNFGSHSYNGGNGNPNIGVGKQNEIEETSKANPGRSLWEVSAVVRVHHTTGLHFLRNKLKISLYLLQIEQQLLEIDKKNRVAYTRLRKEKLWENPNFMIRIVFSDEYSFSLQGAKNKQNCRIWGSQRPRNYQQVPTEFLNANGLMQYLQKWGSTPLFS